MPLVPLRHLSIGLAMLVAVAMAYVLTPREKIADHEPKVDLETMIPKQFGDWKMDTSTVPQQISPEIRAKLADIYSQTLSRSYENSEHQLIMLSIAYGSDQGNLKSLHRPEICYASQGFEILKKDTHQIETKFNTIAATRVLAKNENNTEPITYWMVIGDKITHNAYWRLERLRYGITRKIPDGLLIRVSSHGNNERIEYEMQENFINNLLLSVSEETRVRLIGTPK